MSAREKGKLAGVVRSGCEDDITSWIHDQNMEKSVIYRTVTLLPWASWGGGWV